MTTTKYCKSCKAYSSNFGFKPNGEEYKTCKTCRDKKKKQKILPVVNAEPEEPKICDIEEIKQSFIDLNCEIYTYEKMKWLINLNPKEGKQYFTQIMTSENSAFIETITEDNICNLFQFFDSIGVDHMKMKLGYNCNFVIYTDKHQDKLVIVFTSATNNLFDNFMIKEKLKNRRTCELCCEKSKCFRVCHQCNKRHCVKCFKENNKQFINDCPFCRYTFKEHQIQ
jgi:hypothetical protein